MPEQAPRPLDVRTARSESFLNEWMKGAFDPSLPVSDRLDQAMATDGGEGRRYEAVLGNATGAPPLGSLAGIHNLDELRDRVDGYYGKTPPGFGQVALDMGARYGRDNYNYGVGGSIPSNTNAFDLYNNQKGVCVEIHSAIAAYRTAHGQEAYLVGSSATGNAHAFVVFKDSGHWYVQNYGKVIQTDARNIRDLFDHALPEEVRPQLMRPAADGTLQTVGRGFRTGAGIADRRFSERSGTGEFDPFIKSGTGVEVHGGSITTFDGRTHLSIDPARREFSGGYNYRQEADATHRGVSGFGLRLAPETGRLDAKWEKEDRTVTSDHFGRSRLSLFGGVETRGDSPQYWDNAPTRSTGHVGVSFQQNEAWLHGDGKVKLETGYDAHARAVWTYGLDASTRDAAVQAQNGDGALYLGDVTRMLGDATASAGVNAGAFYRPDPSLTVRGGVRVGEDIASFYSTRPGTALVNGFQPSAYAEATYRKNGIAAGVLAQVLLNEPASYRLASAVGYSPSAHFTVGMGYVRERFLNETFDRMRAGVSWEPLKNLEVEVGADMPAFSKDTPRDVKAVGRVRWNW